MEEARDGGALGLWNFTVSLGSPLRCTRGGAGGSGGVQREKRKREKWRLREGEMKLEGKGETKRG